MWIILNVTQCDNSKIVIQKISLKVIIITGEFSVSGFLLRILEARAGKHCPWHDVITDIETGHYFAAFLNFCWAHDFWVLCNLWSLSLWGRGGRQGRLGFGCLVFFVNAAVELCPDFQMKQFSEQKGTCSRPAALYKNCKTWALWWDSIWSSRDSCLFCLLRLLSKPFLLSWQ